MFAQKPASLLSQELILGSKVILAKRFTSSGRTDVLVAKNTPSFLQAKPS